MKPSNSEQLLDIVVGLYRQYASDMMYFNYPGVTFYSSGGFYWMRHQAVRYFGCAVPFWILFLRDGKFALESPFCLGPGEKVVKDLELEGLSWVKESKRRNDEAERMAIQWIRSHPVVSGQSLQQYLELLNESFNGLSNSIVHSQVSSQIDRPLNAKLLECFRDSTLSKTEIFSLCVSEKKPDVFVHENSLESLRRWSVKKKIDFSPERFEENLKNKDFRKKLQSCYDQGYFLHSGYGGVTLWSLRDEYIALCGTQPPSAPAQAHVRPSLNKNQRQWVQIARHFSELRDRRKSLQQRFFYHQAQLLEEIAKLLNVSRNDLEQLLFDQFTEDFLKGPDLRSVIGEQKRGFLAFSGPDLSLACWTGDDAVRAYDSISSQKTMESKELVGQCACPGKARGRVRIIFNPRLAKDFQEGDVLVTGMTSPDFVPLMKKASAIITELGGVTCHAAIISRELRKPCIIGMTHATKLLKAGELVEVDASSGVVRKIR